MDEKIGSIVYFSGQPEDSGTQEFDIQNLYTWCTWDVVKHGDNCYFEYVDEDGQKIKGETEEEWNAVLSIAKDMKDFSVDFHPLQTKSKYCPKTSSKCCPKAPASCYKPPVKMGSNDCSGKPDCCSTTFKRPLPEPQVDDGKPYIKKVNPDLDQYKYAGDALMAVELPLGPLGGGSIAIAGDGGLRQWQISNRINHNAHVPDSFFAVKVGSTPVALMSSTNYDQSKFKPAPYVTDHYVPQESKTLLSKIPGVKTIEITAKYPVVEVDYIDDALGDVTVHLETWSPKIPKESEKSAIPVIHFEHHVTNKGSKECEVSVLGSLQNIVGWDGLSAFTNEVDNKFYGGNVNTLMTTDNMYGIKMSNTLLGGQDEFNGNVALFCQTGTDDKTSCLLQYQKIETLWNAFKASNQLPGQGIIGVSPTGSTFNGAINLTRTIQPGATSTFKFSLAWHFPNRIKDWSLYNDTIPQTPVYIGTHYSKVWKTIDDVIADAVKNYFDRQSLTYAFRDVMYKSTLPWQLIDSAAGRISVLNSPSCLWQADGYMYIFEGCSSTVGCCPLNCTHVLNYEMALAYLYPDIEKGIREIDLLHNINPYGVVMSRTECPLEIRRSWTLWKDYTTSPTSTDICVDGEIGTVLKVYREYKNAGDKKWFDSVWPGVKRIMNRWLNDLDTKKEGLIFGPQPNTYDVTIYGYNTFIGLLYLCALKATAQMADLQGETDLALQCSKRFEVGTINLDKQCYNGKWYVQVVDPNHQVQLMTDATIVGAMYGQWWAFVLDLGYLLPKDHIKSHLLNTYKRNYVESFDPASQSPRKFADKADSGWVSGKWDKIPKNSLYYMSEIAWSGCLYPFAAMLLNEGCITEGLHMLEVQRQFYDGTRRSPWNEIECGDHYTRPMSAFALFLFASGQKCVEEENGYRVSFNPILCKDNFVGFFILPTCWGTFTQQICNESKQGFVKLKIEHGDLQLARFGMKYSNQKLKNVSVGKKLCVYNPTKDDNYIHASFDKPLEIETGNEFTITFSLTS